MAQDATELAYWATEDKLRPARDTGSLNVGMHYTLVDAIHVDGKICDCKQECQSLDPYN